MKPELEPQTFVQSASDELHAMLDLWFNIPENQSEKGLRAFASPGTGMDGEDKSPDPTYHFEQCVNGDAPQLPAPMSSAIWSMDSANFSYVVSFETSIVKSLENSVDDWPFTL